MNSNWRLIKYSDPKWQYQIANCWEMISQRSIKSKYSMYLSVNCCCHCHCHDIKCNSFHFHHLNIWTIGKMRLIQLISIELDFDLIEFQWLLWATVKLYFPSFNDWIRWFSVNGPPDVKRILYPWIWIWNTVNLNLALNFNKHYMTGRRIPNQ